MKESFILHYSVIYFYFMMGLGELVRFYLLPVPDGSYNFTRLVQRKAYRKRGISKVLMPVAWHPARRWDWYLSEDEKKRINPNFVYY